MPNSFSYATIYSKFLIKNFDAESVLLPLVNRSVEADLANYGETVQVQKFGDVTVSTYTPGSDFNPGTVSMTTDTLTLNQVKAFHFVIDRVEQAKAHHELVKGFTKRASISMAQTVDDRLLGHYADVSAGNILGSDSLPITLTSDNIFDYFVEAGKLLDEDNIPAEGRVAVIDPTTKALIVRSPDFVKNTATGDSVVRSGNIGEMNGFRVVVSNRITTTSGVKNLMFFTPDFISLAMRIDPGSIETYKPEKQFGTGVKGLALYGSDVFHPTAGVVLKKASN